MPKHTDSFSGYPPPQSNAVYTPNQFFDVVLPNSSVACARLVGFAIREILGWSKKDGSPQNKTVSISYRAIKKKAGIPTSSIKAALLEAQEKGFLEPICLGTPNQKGESFTSSEFTLSWDEKGAYTKNISEFRGFFAGVGHRTYIPNVFFDYTLPREPRSLSLVVGAIARYTIGFQDKWGFRRQEVKLSQRKLRELTGLSNAQLNRALKSAQEKGHISVLERGSFATNSKDQTPTTYGLSWADEAERSKNESRPSSRSKLVAFQKREKERSKNESRDVPRMGAGTYQKREQERSKNGSNINNNKNNTLNNLLNICTLKDFEIAVGKHSLETLERYRERIEASKQSFRSVGLSSSLSQHFTEEFLFKELLNETLELESSLCQQIFNDATSFSQQAERSA